MAHELAGDADGHDFDEGPLPPFRLLVEERRLLCPDVDHEAVEALISMLPVDLRPYVFRYFLNWVGEDPEEVLAAFPEIEAEGPPGGRTFVLPQPEHLRVHDPALQAQLERAVARRAPW